MSHRGLWLLFSLSLYPFSFLECFSPVLVTMCHCVKSRTRCWKELAKGKIILRKTFIPSLFYWLKALATVLPFAAICDTHVLFLYRWQRNFTLQMKNDTLDSSQTISPWRKEEKSHWGSHHIELWYKHDSSAALLYVSMTCSCSLAYVYNTRNLLIKTAGVCARVAESNQYTSPMLQVKKYALEQEHSFISFFLTCLAIGDRSEELPCYPRFCWCTSTELSSCLKWLSAT